MLPLLLATIRLGFRAPSWLTRLRRIQRHIGASESTEASVLQRPVTIPAPVRSVDPECRTIGRAGLSRSRVHLSREMSVRTGSAVADAADRAAGDWDATVAHIHLTRRLKSIVSEAGPLCFGRIDEAVQAGSGGGSTSAGSTSAGSTSAGSRAPAARAPAAPRGRRGISVGATSRIRTGEPVVVDWRAPVAVPFYRATFHDTLGLRRRRRFILDSRELVDLIEEDFEHPDSSALAAAGGLPDPLLAELGRARTGTMRDIVATIAGEQDRIIRAPLDVPIVVQGGPGTGKTAVGLHRAAFLLYEHRVQLEREGVLVLGPNRIFLSYIAEVLPSLGEVRGRPDDTSRPGAGMVCEGRGSDRTGRSQGRLANGGGARKGMSPTCFCSDRDTRRRHAVGDCATWYR